MVCGLILAGCSIMNTIYRISLPNNDFAGGMFEARGHFVIPAFDCPECKFGYTHPPVWHASWQPVTSEAQEFCSRPVPARFATSAEYFSFIDEVRRVFGQLGKLFPGSIVGSREIHIKATDIIGALTRKKLMEGIDFAWADCICCVVSDKVYQILVSHGVSFKSSAIRFIAEGEVFDGYRVLELEPQPVWTNAEREKYQVVTCPLCGVTLKKAVGGTFKMKEFIPELFNQGCALVRGCESNGHYLNETLREQFSRANVTGVSFVRAGEWK